MANPTTSEKVVKAPTEDDFIYSSNPLCLDWRDWAVALSILLLAAIAVPYFWKTSERFEPDANYRVSRNTSQDYWLLRGLAEKAAKQFRIVLLGDSAIWGHYVAPEESLSAKMNQKEGGSRYLNFGVSGLHSAALNGLVQHYCDALHDGRIVVQFAPLWMMNPKKDLSDPKIVRGSTVNHPKLLAQFIDTPRQYTADIETRLTTCLSRRASVFSLTEHWTTQATDGQPFATWMIHNPYENPFSKVSLELSNSAVRNPADEDSRAWNTKPGLTAGNIPWVPLNESYQWKQFMEAVRTLKARNNRVFVFLGPFNKDMLTAQSQQLYRSIQAESGRLLTAEGVPFHWAKELDSNLYGDESHPVAAGYDVLAADLLATPEFKTWLQPQGGQ